MKNDFLKLLRVGALALMLCVAFGYFGLRAESEPAATATNATAEPMKPRSLILGEDSTLWDIFQRGGWCMWPILACSILGMAFFIERSVELRRKKHAPKDLDKDVVHVVDTRGVDAGLALCLEKQSSLTRVLYAALLRYGTSRPEMEGAVSDECSRLLYDLRRNCRWIGFLSNMAPLWGLLGTVLGLIQCFDKIAATSGLGKAEQLADGVAVALLTTAWGLLVAIPLLACYQFVKNKADDIVRDINERAIDAIITLDRKARRSIRLIEDIEEHLDTQEMVAAKPPNLDLELDESEHKSSIKSSITTPAQFPAVTPDIALKKASTHGEIKAVNEAKGGTGERKA